MELTHSIIVLVGASMGASMKLTTNLCHRTTFRNSLMRINIIYSDKYHSVLLWNKAVLSINQ